MISTLVRQGSTSPCIRRIRLALLCFSVSANAICAGGVFCFPIISPALVTHLKLTQPQLTTIALVAMMGQYPLAAVVGKILDSYGAWACSLISACLFMVGFGLFSNEISMAPDTTTLPSISTFHHLVILFFIAGVGTVFSYFSSVFAASKNFPNYIGAAAGTSLALFGLSPTLLSFLASRYFSSPDGEVDVTRFFRFLALLCGCVHIIGGFTMHVVPPASIEERSPAVATSDPEIPNERTPLLSNKTNGNDDGHDQAQVEVVSHSDNSKDGALDLLSDRNFYVLAFIMFVVLGSCETIISNIGTIVLSLPSRRASAFADTSSTVVMTAAQVRVLSLANTLSRLLVGPLADILSPVPSHAIDGNRGFVRQHRVSRIAFLTFATTLLVCTYIWMVIGVRDQSSIWALSVGAGLAYGCTFTVIPSLVSSIWGLSNLGRNFGLITYAPFFGTPAFSYLYAFVSDAHTSDSQSGSESDRDGVCRGPACWTLTFEVSAFAAALACLASFYLWRAWKGRV